MPEEATGQPGFRAAPVPHGAIWSSTSMAVVPSQLPAKSSRIEWTVHRSGRAEERFAALEIRRTDLTLTGGMRGGGGT